jgi:hypothetical protein
MRRKYQYEQEHRSEEDEEEEGAEEYEEYKEGPKEGDDEDEDKSGGNDVEYNHCREKGSTNAEAAGAEGVIPGLEDLLELVSSSALR